LVTLYEERIGKFIESANLVNRDKILIEAFKLNIKLSRKPISNVYLYYEYAE